MASKDGGARWRPIARIAGVLAWPRPDRLYLITAEGQTLVSGDGGCNFDALATSAVSPLPSQALVTT